MKFAAIDIGTNAARLLVGEISDDNGLQTIQKVSYSRIPLRLGEEVFDTGEISKDKKEDFVKCIRAFRLIASIFDTDGFRACATSAMREASNGQEIREEILKRTGVDIEIISGDEEASLIFNSFSFLDIEDDVPYIVVDVGGGSTEINVFEDGRRVASKSFKVGTLRMLKGKVKDSIWNDIKAWISEHVDLHSVHKMYATGGNINKTHKLLGASYMEPLAFEAIDELKSELSTMTVNERINAYQLRPDRADVIVPALEIYLYILNELDCKEIVVPKIGLADGMIYAMYEDTTRSRTGAEE